MKLFNGLFNRKKKLSKYKDERVKLLKFENDLTDVVPASYNGIFSVIDSSNAGENFEFFQNTLNIDQEFVLIYLDRDKLNHDLLIEMINIKKAAEIKNLEQELDLVEAHIKSNEVKIMNLGKELEDYEEHEQEALQERVPADPQEELVG